MVEEIRNPLRTIFQILDSKILDKKIQDQTNTLLTAKDVSFNRDTTIIEELVVETGLPYHKAEAIAIQFFEQIKQFMMQESVVCVDRVGRFYAVAPHIRNGKVIFPTKNSLIYPKFRPTKEVKVKERQRRFHQEVEDYLYDLEIKEVKIKGFEPIETIEQIINRTLENLEKKFMDMDYNKEEDDEKDFNNMDGLSEEEIEEITYFSDE